MAFGKFFLLPILGTTLFGWLTYALKNVHNFVGPLFAVSLLGDHCHLHQRTTSPTAPTLSGWLAAAACWARAITRCPSHRFNAGEKGLFWWGITIPGIFVVATGPGAR